MTYVYKCPNCSNTIDIIKSYKLIDKIEMCPCGFEMDRIMQPCSFDIKYIHQKVEWDHGLGQFVKNKRERKEAMKKRGLIEVGNEDIGKHTKVAKRRNEEKFDKEWREL